MSKKAKIVAMFTAISMFAVIAFFLVFPGQPGKSQGLGANYSNIILIETEQVKDEFEFKDSLIGPLIKAKVTYARPNNNENPQPILYETLWFHGWQTLGCRRVNDLTLDNGQSIIQVQHKSGYGSLTEGEAAAKAILRVFVDMYAQKHAVSTIIVPDESMDYILNQMPQAGFTPGPRARPDVPVYSPIIIPVTSASGSANQVLYYTTPPR